jgi:hypothetical protein
MSDVPSRSALAKLGIDSANPTTKAFEFIDCGLRKRSTQYHSEGVRGTRSRKKWRVREVRRECSGPISMYPTTTELDLLWVWLVGGASSPWSPAETLVERYIQVDKIAKVYTYAGCVASRWTLSGSSGQPVRLTIEVEAETETEGNAGTFPSITIPTDNFFIFSDLTLTLGGSARKFGSFSLTWDNLVDADRYNNSLTRAEIAGMDRAVSMSVGTPYTTDNADLYNIAVAGAAASLVMADGTTTYTFDVANAKIPDEGPELSGKAEIMLPLTVNCFADDTNPELKITKT